MTSDKNRLIKLLLKNTKGEEMELVVKDSKRSGELNQMLAKGWTIRRRSVIIIEEENLDF